MGEEGNRTQRLEDLLFDIELEFEEYESHVTVKTGREESAKEAVDSIMDMLSEARKLI